MKQEFRRDTLVFLLKKDSVLLAMKKRGFGMGRWNGVGGKVEQGETLDEAAIRETKEEIGVTPLVITPVATLKFYYPPQRAKGKNIQVKVYTCTAWQGEPAETEEMRPQWFGIDKIPYEEMWSDDKYWLPLVLGGKKLEAEFYFDSSDGIKNYELKELHEKAAV